MTNHPNRGGTRYTLAFIGDWLVACVPSGHDISKATREECDRAAIDWQEPDVITGVHLTDDPRDTDEVVYSGSRMGWLTDDSGRSYRYAVKR